MSLKKITTLALLTTTCLASGALAAQKQQPRQIQATGPELRGSRTLDIQTISLQDFVGQVEFKPSATPQTIISFEGQDEHLKHYQLQSEKGKVSISTIGLISPKREPMIERAQLKQMKAATKLIIETPETTALNMSLLNSDASLDSRAAPVNLTVTEGQVQANRIQDISYRVNGDGELRIHRVTGNMNYEAQGRGALEVNEIDSKIVNVANNGQVTAKIRKGNIQALNCSINGQGKFNFAGIAQDANLAINGAARIELGNVQSKPNIQLTGLSKVKINGENITSAQEFIPHSGLNREQPEASRIQPQQPQAAPNPAQPQQPQAIAQQPQQNPEQSQAR